MSRDFYALIERAIRVLAREHEIPAQLATRALSPTDRIADLGLDSVGRLHLLLEIEGDIGKRLPEGELYEVATLAELAALVERVASTR